tara:strand:- start:79 stop:294 length:216 start_codon:yes stop_codon:yes gene_type:complete
MNIVGKNIKRIRESKPWTQEVLVAKCQVKQWEITRSTLAKVESNVRRVTDIEVKRFAQILEVSIDELFTEN